MAKKATNWKLWGKMMLGSQRRSLLYWRPGLHHVGVADGGGAFQEIQPELQARSLANREKTQAEFDQFVTKLKEYSKSDRPIWTVRDEDIERQKAAQAFEQRRKEAELKAQQAAMRRESGMSDDLD
ncbi:cbp4 domain-containing protein [Colletotrichum tofieldiae]|nr:cbp4 domain-containing protein [Colletotrichum tofieldiae]